MNFPGRKTAALAFAAALAAAPGCASGPLPPPHPGNDIVCKSHKDKTTVFTGRANGYTNGDANTPTQVDPASGGRIVFKVKGGVKCEPAAPRQPGGRK
jgi:hypothetical protein